MDPVCLLVDLFKTSYLLIMHDWLPSEYIWIVSLKNSLDFVGIWA